MAAQQEADQANAEQVRGKLSQWTADEAVTPTNTAIQSADPSYDTTIEFINGSILGKGQKMWFGKRTEKMILESQIDLLIFDPKSLTPEVKYSVSPNQAGEYIVELFTTNGRPQIQWVSKITGETKNVNGLKLRTGDNLDRDKLVKACVHLIKMFGGEPDAF